MSDKPTDDKPADKPKPRFTEASLRARGWKVPTREVFAEESLRRAGFIVPEDRGKGFIIPVVGPVRKKPQP